MFVPYIYDVAQKGQLSGREGSLFRPAELGNNLVHGLDIVEIFKASDGDQRPDLGLAQQIFRLGGSERGVNRHQNRADLCQSKLKYDPFGNIGRPYRNPISTADSNRDKSFCDLARDPLEVAEIISMASVWIYQGIILRKVPGKLCQQAANRYITVHGRALEH